MTDPYPFDPDVREHVARLLYDHLPALYRVRDEGGLDLKRFLAVLAAPLSELRQNVEELHGDLFIDTCNDWIIPYIAQMVGVDLIFPDAPSNRRDVRGAVAWRRRKGTPDALEEMASDLSGQMVVTHEGWKRLLCAQDLNLLRPERVVGDLRRATIAEAAAGPLDASLHALDPRSVSARTGRYHPAQVIHWIHPTRLFRVRESVALDRTRRSGIDGSVLDADLRYAIHPLGLRQAVRVRREHPRDPIPTDRVPAMHFAAAPEAYFDQEGGSTGRFTIRLSGLPAAVAAPARELRQASLHAADPSLVAAEVAVALLGGPLDGLTANVRVDVYAAPLDPVTHVPEVAGGQRRGGMLVPTQGASAPVADPPELAPVSSAVALVRLRPEPPATAAYFPGASIEIASQAVDALHSSAVPGLAADGFLRGALIVELPRTWVRGERWLYVAADGSVYDAQSPEAAQLGAEPDVPVDVTGGVFLPGRALAVGPGPAWPPLRKTAVDERMTRVPSAPGRGPVFLHGGPVRRRNGDALEPIGGSYGMALSFAARIPSGGGAVYHPFLRLQWSGEHPLAGGTWDVLDAAGAPIASAAGRSARLQAVAEEREAHALEIELVVRFEAEQAELVLPPCEVAFTSDDGQTILVHLPSLETAAAVASDWAAGPAPLSRRSLPVSVGADGSTRTVGAIRTARYALGSVAPLQTATLRRRRVRQRTLCGWDREQPNAVPPIVLAPTPPGYLDVDPEHGLFAVALAEPPRPYPALSGGGGAPLPSPVTVDTLEGYSDHIGARADAREPLLGERQPRPTRLVSASGRLHPGAPAEWHAIPRYFNLPEALAAVEAALAGAAGEPVEEVIQLEDSATYPLPEVLEWPMPPPGVSAALTLQAAEGQRPVLRQEGTWGLPSGWESQGHYASLTLRGLVIGTGPISVPPAERVAVQFCTLASHAASLAFRSPPGIDGVIEVVRSITATITLSDPGVLRVEDSVIDAEPQAIIAPLGTVELARVTVMSRVAPSSQDPGTEALVLEATESIFVDRVEVHDRFHGCIRYSRAPAGSVLPRRHRVVTVAPRFVSRVRHDPAHARLATDCPLEILRGAEDGSEMGAFHGVRLAQRQEALIRRLVDFTPAGLLTGIVRMD